MFLPLLDLLVREVTGLGVPTRDDPTSFGARRRVRGPYPQWTDNPISCLRPSPPDRPRTQDDDGRAPGTAPPLPVRSRRVVGFHSRLVGSEIHFGLSTRKVWSGERTEGDYERWTSASAASLSKEFVTFDWGSGVLVVRTDPDTVSHCPVSISLNLNQSKSYTKTLTTSFHGPIHLLSGGRNRVPLLHRSLLGL